MLVQRAVIPRCLDRLNKISTVLTRRKKERKKKERSNFSDEKKTSKNYRKSYCIGGDRQRVYRNPLFSLPQSWIL